MIRKMSPAILFYYFNKRVNNIPMLVSIRKGLTYMIPLLLLGSVALLLLSLPVPAYQQFMARYFGENWNNLFLLIRDGTFSIMSLLMVICISFAYVNELGQKSNVSSIITACVSLASYIAISGISKDGFSISSFGATGIFIAIIVSSGSAFLFVRLSSVDALKLRAYTNGANAAYNHALTSIFPAAFTISLFAAANVLLSDFFHISNIQDFLSEYFSNLFTQIENPFFSGILFILLVHIFWFFGMHGSNVLEPVTLAVFAPGVEWNQLLLAGGHTPETIFTKTFFDCFILMGGCGTAICLVSAILIAGRYKNQRKLAKLSSLPLLFNINELIIFGMPIVLNPIFFIPFLGVPILLTITSYLSMRYGLIPYTFHPVEWTTPIFLSGYIATQSIGGSLLQLFNLAFGTACYIPFVKLSEHASKEQLRDNLQKIYQVYKENEERGYPPALLSRHDEIGNISRFLAADLVNDLKNHKLKLYYQPQTDYSGKVFGIEALLRWKHNDYGYIYPPLIIALAEEINLIDNLGYWIFDRALSDLRKLQQSGYHDISLSVNVSAVQLENENMVERLKEQIDENSLSYQSVKIEITEQIALAGSHKIMDQIDSIKKLGIKLAMDDFGMGHSSLKYLKQYEFDTIKLDGSLIREVVVNNNCRSIISSIVYLCKSLECSIIAEYVEEELQKDVLYQLGCEKYQGYLYSKPLPYTELIEYLNRSFG